MAADMALETYVQHRSFLEEFIEPDYGLLDKLQANRPLTYKEILDIKEQRPYFNRNSKLLEYIFNKQKCDALTEALKETEQTHIVNYLVGNGEWESAFGEDWPLTKTEISILDINRECLVDLLDTETVELLARLYASEVINKRQMNKISAASPIHEKNEILLDILRRRSLRHYKLTIQCLHNLKQQHIAELLNKGGVFVKVHAAHRNPSVEFAETEDEIIAKFKSIVETKSSEELDEINCKLENTGIKVVSIKRSQSLLLYFYCKKLVDLVSVHKFLIEHVHWLFAQLLHPAKYTGLWIRNSKVVVESAYGPQYTEFTVDMSQHEYERCLSYFPAFKGIRVRAAYDFEAEEKKESIGLPSDYKAISFKKGDLMKVVSKHAYDYTTSSSSEESSETSWLQVFHFGNGETGVIPRNLVVRIFDRETRPTSNIFGSSWEMNMKDRKSWERKSSLYDLPLELIDIVLEKTCHMILMKETQNARLFRDADVMVHLASVDVCWYKRITKKKFRKKIKHLVPVSQKENEKVSMVYKNNRHFLEEFVDWKSLIQPLKSGDCLTDMELLFLKGQKLLEHQKSKHSHKRQCTAELLNFIRRHSYCRIQSEFTRSLLDCSEKRSTRLAGEGGVMVKVQLKHEDVDLHKRLVMRLKALHDKTKQRPHQVDVYYNQLKRDGIEIIDSYQDRDTIVWIRCQSTKVLAKLQDLYKSNNISNMIYDLTMIESPLPGMKTVKVNIDREQTKKKVVFLPTFVNLSTDIPIEEAVVGVTKLQNRITVLCENHYGDCIVYLYDDRVPFHLEKKLEINELEHPRDIAFNAVENCHYVIAGLNPDRCIWKITDDLKVTEWLSINLSEPLTLSVTTEGNLLKLYTSPRTSERIPVITSVNIYGKDADLLISVPLPEEVQYPFHAVETSNGNFIIAHLIIEKGKDLYTGELEKLRVISEFSRNGLILRCLLRVPTQVLSPPPWYLSIDSCDRLFVANGKEGKVRIFEHGGQYQFIQAKGYKGARPERIIYDETKKQLIIGGSTREMKSDFGYGVTVYSLDNTAVAKNKGTLLHSVISETLYDDDGEAEDDAVADSLEFYDNYFGDVGADNYDVIPYDYIYDSIYDDYQLIPPSFH